MITTKGLLAGTEGKTSTLGIGCYHIATNLPGGPPVRDQPSFAPFKQLETLGPRPADKHLYRRRWLQVYRHPSGLLVLAGWRASRRSDDAARLFAARNRPTIAPS